MTKQTRRGLLTGMAASVVAILGIGANKPGRGGPCPGCLEAWQTGDCAYCPGPVIYMDPPPAVPPETEEEGD